MTAGPVNGRNAERLRGMWERARDPLALAVPLAGFAVSLPRSSLHGPVIDLTDPINIYDEGLHLTLTTFSSLSRLPYRDLWTLYGPGPTVWGPLVDGVFGRNLLASRLATAAVAATMIVALHLLLRRLAGRTWAMLGATFVAVAALPPLHFTTMLSFVLWGAWCFVTAGDRRTGAPRGSGLVPGELPAAGVEGRVVIGLGLIGWAFLGRYEYAAVSVALVLLAIYYLRGSVSRTTLRRGLVAGLVPPGLFGGYLLLVVGWATAYENLVRYPLRFYPRPWCRGIPTDWRATMGNALAPLERGWWTPHDLIVAVGNLGVPLLAAGLLAVAWRERKARSPATLAVLLLAILDALLWVQMRSRNGAIPLGTIPAALVSVAILLDRAPRTAWRTVASGAAQTVLLVALVLGWLPGAFSAWRDLPPYDPLYGFSRHWESPLYELGAIEELTRAVHEVTEEGEPIFVALERNEGTVANAPALYWLLDRPPATRYIEFNPCLTDRPDIQERMVADLEGTRVIVTTTFFPGPPFADPPATVLDAYVDREFELTHEILLGTPDDVPRHAYRVRVRR